MQAAICFLAVIPMRKEPSHRSEMVSQVLFGEYVTVGEEREDFVFVSCYYDGYEGWVQRNQLTPVDSNDILQTSTFTSAFTTLVTKNNQLLYVPYNTPVYQQNAFSFGAAGSQINYLLQAQQTWQSENLPFSRVSLEAVIQPYINAPYLWGGKSVFGIDCSGFVQQVFKVFGVKLLRDAYLQAEQGVAVNSTEEAHLGDLAFFQNETGRVTHVGIVLEDNKIVHASGQVRIDKLDSEGIKNSNDGKPTHRLHSIRKVFLPH
jgi:cell wall-associated NlpC family hydrolase